MRISVPYAGKVEKRVLRFLYYNRSMYSTKAIARALHDKREHVYSALQRLYRRGYVIKRIRRRYRRRYCIWGLNTRKLPLIRKALGISEQRHVRKGEPRYQVVKPIGMPALKIWLAVLAMNTPLAREIYCTYKIVDNLYSDWRLVQQCYSNYQEEGIAGVGKTLGRSVVSDFVGDLETTIFWSIIENRIQPEYRDTAKEVLSTIVSSLTEEEIRYVEQYLEKN